MIKVEDDVRGLKCTIEGCASDVALDITTIFETVSNNESLELVLLACIETFLTHRSKEILNKKGDK